MSIMEVNQKANESDRVMRLLKDYENQKGNVQQSATFKKQTSRISYLRQNGERKWLCQKGKGYLIDFNQHERKKMKNFFNALDKKNCGSIGLDELQQVLLGLGLAENAEQVKALMNSVDEDHSGKIEFEEFLEMIQDDKKQNEEIVNFFKELIVSQLKPNDVSRSDLEKKMHLNSNSNTMESLREQLKECPKNVSFEMLVNQIRRSHILSSMNIGRRKIKEENDFYNRVKKGKQVVQSLQKMEERRLIRCLREGTEMSAIAKK